MYELRWILLAAGIALVAGLWVWEWQRSRMAARSGRGEGGPERIEPQVAGDAGAGMRRAAQLPSIRATSADRVAQPRNPPVIEIPAGAEPELSRTPVMRTDDTLAGTMPVVDAAVVRAEQRQAWVRTQPLDVSDGLITTFPAGAEPDATAPVQPRRAAPSPPDPDSRSAAARQRIVALRLISGGDRWTGMELGNSLEGEGMRFGRYSIYHRQRDDGKTIFYAASLVEPGSFDQERLDEPQYPGISLFAVLPGPIDAPTVFDQMLATARRLADRLHGQLQDEDGSSLTPQRILSLREELVHFDHLSLRSRQR